MNENERFGLEHMRNLHRMADQMGAKGAQFVLEMLGKSGVDFPQSVLNKLLAKTTTEPATKPDSVVDPETGSEIPF